MHKYVHITKGFFCIWQNCVGSAAGPCLSGWLNVILKILVLRENHSIWGHNFFFNPNITKVIVIKSTDNRGPPVYVQYIVTMYASMYKLTSIG